MPKRIIYFGPLNNNKKEELIKKSLKALKRNEGSKFYYLLPNGELLTKYRRDFINSVKQTFEINLYTFDNIVKNILEYENSIDINEAIKDAIIKKLIKELDSQGKIKYYKDFISMEGFSQSINGIIGELKRSLVYPKEYIEKCPKIPYYEEIGLIYKAYESYLEKYNLLDREGSYFKSIEILKNSEDYFNGLDFIIIDEFYDFRPIEISILKEICKSNIDIYINIPFEIKSKSSNVKRTIGILRGIGFKLEYIEKKENSFFENMGTNLFNHTKEKLNYNQDLYLIKAPSTYLEMKKIFEKIKKHYKNGIKLDDMAIVLLNEDYKEALIEVAEQEKVPITLTKDKVLREVPLVSEFLNIIKMKVNEDKKTIINRLKSYYFNMLEEYYRNSLEYIIRRLDFENTNKLIDLLSNEKQLNIPIKYIQIIKDFINKVIEETSKINDCDFIENYNNGFLEIIDSYKLEKGIYERYKLDKDYDLLYRDLSTIGKLKDIIKNLNDLSDIVGEISIKDYYEILCKMFKEDFIQESNENINGIKILNPINSRGFKHKILFVTALSQEDYPKLKENNFFINDENNSTLEKIGLDVKDYYERLDNELMKFSSLITSCEEKLYLSFSEGVEGNNISSIFLDEILNMIQGDSLRDKVNLIDIDLSYSIKDDIKKITTENELLHYILLNQKKKPLKEFKNLVSIYNRNNEGVFKNINKKLESEYKRSKEEFNEFSGLIDEEEIIKDIEKINENKVYSNTYLESYAKCPYQFLLSRLLYVEEMERESIEYSPMDVGNIYHEVLNQYYKTYKKDIIGKVKKISSFKVEDTLDFIKKMVYRYGEDFGFNQKNKMDLLILENIEEKIKEFIFADIKRLSKNDEKIIPYEFEVDFGMEEDFSIQVSGEKIKLKGKIDRIDKLLDKDKYIIMDYKSSDYGIYDIDKIQEGLSLQLPIYAMSQENKKIVAGLYGILKNSKFQMTIGILDETKIVTKRHKGALSQESWKNLMNQSRKNIKDIKDSILRADFSVKPLECSDYCIYKDICRYENKLEVK